MTRANQDVARAFRELADLIEITGGERFRILAYRRASDTIGRLGIDIADLSAKDLITLQGIGKATADKIREYLGTGKLSKLEEMRSKVPKGVRELTGLAGLGPKKAMLLHAELGVESLEDLRKALDAQLVREIKGLGPKTEENLLRALHTYSTEERRILLSAALKVAERMRDGLLKARFVRRCEYAGSLRRMRETIGDIDLLAAGADPDKIMDAFTSLPDVARIAARGPAKSSVITNNGIQVDLRVVAPDEWGAALQYFTGSKEHNVKVREHAVKNGFKLSEYGLFRVEGGERVAAATEEEVYAALGMDTPPPTMRENNGEVELALAGELPQLVEVEDIRGDLQGHSRYSDGSRTVLEMAREFASRGFDYWAVTDHGRRISIVKHLDIEDIQTQKQEIRKANDILDGKFTVMHGVELNIGGDGELDYPDEVLERFDIVVASVHSPPWDYEGMTRRLLRAIENPHVDIVGHPTGRRIGRRPGGEFDLEAVFRAAAKRRVAMEVNANPQRLDLRDDHVRLANDMGCLFAIDTDAHKFSDIDFMRLGVCTAQRGWLTKDRVINAWPLNRLEKHLASRSR